MTKRQADLFNFWFDIISGLVVLGMIVTFVGLLGLLVYFLVVPGSYARF